jgi:hypothetical protein
MTTKTQIMLIFILFLLLSRPHQFFWKKFEIYFGLTSPPILVEFNAPIGFYLRQPRLDLYSFFSYFELFPDLTNFLGKNFEFFFGLAPSPILTEFNAPIGF